MLDKEIVNFISRAPSVLKMVGDKTEAIPLRPEEINRILGKMEAASDVGAQVEVPFFVGEPVRIVDGPFSGFNGVIEEINEEKKKLKVVVKIFGRRTPVELNYMQVEKS